MFPVLAENMKGDGGRVEIVRVTGIVSSLVSVHSTNTQGGAGGGGGVLDLDHAGPRHQLPVVFPHHELGAHDGGADDALQVQGAELSDVDVGTSEYSDLEEMNVKNVKSVRSDTDLGHNHHQLHLSAHLGHRAHLTLVFPSVSGGQVLDLQGPQVLPGFDQRGKPVVRDECFLIHSNDVAVRPSDPGD